MSEIREWLLTTPLFQWAYRQGGIDSFRQAHQDIMSTMEDDLDRRAEALAKQKVANLLSVVDEQHVVNARGKLIYLGSEQIDDQRLANLKSDAAFLLESELWKVIYETPKALAEKAMFVDDGDVATQLLKGRAILYTLATQKKIVELFKSLSTSG